MALTPEELAQIVEELTPLVQQTVATAQTPLRVPRPPSDLQYEGNGRYWSEVEQSYYQKGGGGTLIKTGQA